MNSGEPLFTDSLEKLWNDRDRSGVVRGILAQLPVQRFLDSINSRIALKQQGSLEGRPTTSLVASVLKRYSHNKRLIEAAARAYEVQTAFVWQPVPSYRYHLRHYLSDPQKDWLQSLTKNGYTAMSGIVKDNPKDYAQNFLWLADIQEQSTESLYVDSFHYNDKFSNVSLFTSANSCLSERSWPVSPEPGPSKTTWPRPKVKSARAISGFDGESAWLDVPAPSSPRLQISIDI